MKEAGEREKGGRGGTGLAHSRRAACFFCVFPLCVALFRVPPAATHHGVIRHPVLGRKLGHKPDGDLGGGLHGGMEMRENREAAAAAQSAGVGDKVSVCR